MVYFIKYFPFEMILKSPFSLYDTLFYLSYSRLTVAAVKRAVKRSVAAIK